MFFFLAVLFFSAVISIARRDQLKDYFSTPVTRTISAVAREEFSNLDGKANHDWCHVVVKEGRLAELNLLVKYQKPYQKTLETEYKDSTIRRELTKQKRELIVKIFWDRDVKRDKKGNPIPMFALPHLTVWENVFAYWTMRQLHWRSKKIVREIMFQGLPKSESL